MDSATSISNPSARAQGLSQELGALIRERRVQDPTLGLPDVLVAMELVKASLFSELGVSGATHRALAIVAGLLVAGVAAFLFFASQ